MNVWFEADKLNRKVAVFNEICSRLNLTDFNNEVEEKLMSCSKIYCLNLTRKWEEASRNRQRFNQRYKDWINSKLWIPERLTAATAVVPDNAEQPQPNRGPGRPRKSFDECSVKTKKRRVAEFAAGRTSHELKFAAGLVDNNNLSNQDQTPSTSSLTPHQALALYLDLDLSERKYNLLRSVVNEIHKDCFPSLYAINQVKNALLPSSINVSETSAEVDVQELVQKTAESIAKVTDLKEGKQVKLTCKWGFDGSSGHSQYKQKFTETSSTDEFLFLVAMVPLKLTDVLTEQDLWVNSRSSSTLFCRPLKFIFQKENAELVRNEEKSMVDKINQLQTFEIKCNNGQTCLVSCEMIFTMMDGSVSNILSDTNSTSKCIICQATPKEMNKVDVVNRPSSVEKYRFGLSTLHCWIRFFECLLHIGYRLPVKVWQVRGKEFKDIVDNNKKRIQAEFKAKMGLIVDKPKPGYGSTNDGNTARRFFYNPDLSSQITGVDKGLILKFSIILRVLASGCHIDLGKFRELLLETRQLYISLYDWYYMPSSVHKVLLHACEIIGSFSLPIGQLSEDALESRHKEVRKNRLLHTRKCSRINSNKDLMRVLLLTSEPLISSMRKVTTKRSVRVDTEVEGYLIRDVSTDVNMNIGSYDSDSSESD